MEERVRERQCITKYIVLDYSKWTLLKMDHECEPVSPYYAMNVNSWAHILASHIQIIVDARNYFIQKMPWS